MRMKFADTQSLLIIVVGLILMLSLVFGLTNSNVRLAERAAVNNARSYSDTLSVIRNFYQLNVVERLQGTDAKVVHNFRQVEGAVPIPATMMIELTSFLNQSNDEITFALVSDYPFPWRKNRPLVDFDRRSLAFFRKNGEGEFYEFNEENGTTYLHYARPVVMSQGCVECHNSHSESPKTDWKVGDVRAVQILEIPYDDAESEMSLETAITGSFVVILSVTTIFWLLASNLRSQEAKRELTTEAHFDSLTGAMRRPRFQELYDHRDRERDYYFATVDIDDFKSFNTNYGHSTGDKVLRDVVKTLESCTPQAEVLCRYGGEEFVLLVSHDLIKDDPDDYFKKMVERVGSYNFNVDDRITRVTITIGYSLLEISESMAVCAERADAALRYAKRSGKNQAVQADSNLLQRLGFLGKTYTISDLEAFLFEKSLFFDFQPIVNIKDGSIVSFEALIRLQLKDGTIELPPAFLPQYMAILRNPANFVQFSQMLANSLDASAHVLKNIKRVAFNLDPYDLVNNLENNCLIKSLKELTLHGFEVIIEIVETPYMDEISEDDFVKNLNLLRQTGFSIYMDDFGKEGSSIQRFLSFDFDCVKIDRSILTNLAESPKTQNLISVLVEISQRNNFSIIAEGVEHQLQEDILSGLGVKYAQGFLYKNRMRLS